MNIHEIRTQNNYFYVHKSERVDKNKSTNIKDVVYWLNPYTFLGRNTSQIYWNEKQY